MQISSCLNGLLWSKESFEESTISDLESPSNFQVKEIFFIEIGQETTKLSFNQKCQNRHA